MQLQILQRNHILEVFPMISFWTMLDAMEPKTHYLIVHIQPLITVAQLKVQGLSV